MKRLLQFVTVMMLIAAFIPLLEFFDQWDAPGLSNDTEYAVFAFVLSLCLVLLVCKLMSLGALKLNFISVRVFLRDIRVRHTEVGHTSIFAVPPLLLTQLRI